MRSETRFLKNNGIYYTNNKLANIMIDNLEIDFDGNFTLLELAVGEGHIYKLGGEIKINPNYQGFFFSASILINESED